MTKMRWNVRDPAGRMWCFSTLRKAREYVKKDAKFLSRRKEDYEVHLINTPNFSFKKEENE